jgi:hypothetical protein
MQGGPQWGGAGGGSFADQAQKQQAMGSIPPGGGGSTGFAPPGQAQLGSMMGQMAKPATGGMQSMPGQMAQASAQFQPARAAAPIGAPPPVARPATPAPAFGAQGGGGFAQQIANRGMMANALRKNQVV